jgi:hypothetical protein
MPTPRAVHFSARSNKIVAEAAGNGLQLPSLQYLAAVAGQTKKPSLQSFALALDVVTNATTVRQQGRSPRLLGHL